MNLLEATIVDGGVQLGPAGHPDRPREARRGRGRGRQDRHPRRPARGPPITDGSTGIPVQVIVVEELGADAYVYGELTELSGGALDVIVRVDGRTPPAKGETSTSRIQQGHVHLFSTVTGKRL